MKVGVVIGRFQVPDLTTAHINLLNEACKASHELVILVGCAPLYYTNRNPLTFSMRASVLRSYYPSAHIWPINDVPDNKEWSEHVDELLTRNFPNYEITLYHGPDSFAEVYKGKLPCVFVPGPPIHGTEVRNAITEINSPHFRKGFIHAINVRRNKTIPCVDIAMINRNSTKDEHVLLGRKRNEKTWRFPGGMVDVGETLEYAASRELFEETGMTHEGSLKYVGSAVVGDWRCRGTDTGMVSALFWAHHQFGQPKAGDDLAEVAWIRLEYAEHHINDGHKKLLEILKGTNR